MKNTIYLLLALIHVTCYAQESENITKMILIPGGEFNMGKDSEHGADFSPVHTVFVDSFFMDIHEVTNRQYREFCQEAGHQLPEFWGEAIFHSGEDFLDHPVVGVNWYDAMKYARWAGKRLPTEAEWEYAARGGLVDNEFPNGYTWNTPLRRNMPGSWENQTVEVKSFEPNGFGLYNMGGNVWEWVSDIYAHDYYQSSPKNNPKGPANGTNRVIRGGSWHSGKMCHKVYYRKGLTSNWKDFAVGFRCVKDFREK